MSEKPAQVNIMNDGRVIVGEYPDQSVQPAIDTQSQNRR